VGEPLVIDRSAWRRLSAGLIGYGLVALVIGLLWLGTLLWANGRAMGVRDEILASMPPLTRSAELTARALREGATTATSFRTSLDQSAAALVSSAATITTVRSDLSAFEAQLRSVSILGARPLASPADAVGRIAAGMDGLDTKLGLIADSLGTGQDALAANATSLAALGERADALAISLAVTDVRQAFEDIQLLLIMGVLLCAASALLPAVGALGLGLWLRRLLGAARPG
jgi:hypothetical protein